MASFSATLGVIILSGFINLSAANKDTCELYAAVGQSLTLPFVYEGLAKNSHILRWTHDKKIIFYGQTGRVSVGKPDDISATGSLLLKNLQLSSAGTYQANVLHPNNTLAKEWTGRLCMTEISKPQLTYTCDFKSNAVNLNCHVAKPQGLAFSWTLDEKTLTSETRQTLSISLEQLKGQRSFTCSVTDKLKKEKSDTVRPTCKSPSPPALLCFTPKTVVAVVAGAAGLILLFLVIIITLCCSHRRSKKQLRLREEGDLRMLSLNKREPDSICPDYETMHPTEDSPPVSAEPSPRECYKSVSQPESEPENRPAQLSAAAEEQKPSPVPKPRTKSPPTSNI